MNAPRALVLVLALTLAAPAARADEEPVAVALQRALSDLQTAGALARQGGAAARVEALCEAACRRYAAVLARLDELPPAEREVRAQLAHYNSACARALQGRTGAAFLHLERALGAGYGDWRQLRADPDLASLRGDERFAGVVRRAWLPGACVELHLLMLQARQALQEGRALARRAAPEAAARLEVAVERAQAALSLARDLYASDLSLRTARARLHYLVGCARALQRRPEEARQHLVAALVTELIDPRLLLDDPDLASLREEEGFRSRALASQRAWAGRPADPAPIVLEWLWTFEDDLEPAELEAQAEVLRGWARALWEVSEGNIRLKRATLRDRAERVGELHTPRGAVERSMLLSGELYAAVSVGTVYVPGRCGAFTFVHEVGHLLCWLPEEYDTPDGCPCAQAGERGRLTWCDDASHSAGQARLGKPSCWRTIQDRFPQVRHPGPGGAAPAVEIELDDRR